LYLLLAAYRMRTIRRFVLVHFLRPPGHHHVLPAAADLVLYAPPTASGSLAQAALVAGNHGLCTEERRPFQAPPCGRLIGRIPTRDHHVLFLPQQHFVSLVIASAACSVDRDAHRTRIARPARGSSRPGPSPGFVAFTPRMLSCLIVRRWARGMALGRAARSAPPNLATSLPCDSTSPAHRLGRHAACGQRVHHLGDACDDRRHHALAG